jgi:hypothetical protein
VRAPPGSAPVIVLKITSKSSPPYNPNIIFESLISILAVNPDLLNIASVSYIFFFTEERENHNGPDLVQAFLKKWWVESDLTAPNLPLPSKLLIRSKNPNGNVSISGTISVSPFKTFMNFSGISFFFIVENSEIQFLLSINKLYIS